MSTTPNYLGAAAFISALLCAALAIPVLQRASSQIWRRLALLCAFSMLVECLPYLWNWPESLIHSDSRADIAALILNLVGIDLMLWHILDGRTLLQQVRTKLLGQAPPETQPELLDPSH